MKKIVLIVIVCLPFTQCKKAKVESVPEEVTKQIANDSILKLFDKYWKLDKLVYPEKLNTQLNNWNEWRLLSEDFKQKPINNVHSYQAKIKTILKHIKKLERKLPEQFKIPQIKSRLNVFKSHMQQLEMYLGLNPLPYSKINTLFLQSEKDVVSLINELKLQKTLKIPIKNSNEDLKSTINILKKSFPKFDTIKRANTKVFK